MDEGFKFTLPRATDEELALAKQLQSHADNNVRELAAALIRLDQRLGEAADHLSGPDSPFSQESSLGPSIE